MLMVFCKAVTALIACALLFVGGVQLEFQRWCSQRQAFRPVGWIECDVHAAGFQGASQDDDDDFKPEHPLLVHLGMDNAVELVELGQSLLHACA